MKSGKKKEKQGKRVRSEDEISPTTSQANKQQKIDELNDQSFKDLVKKVVVMSEQLNKFVKIQETISDVRKEQLKIIESIANIEKRVSILESNEESVRESAAEESTVQLEDIFNQGVMIRNDVHDAKSSVEDLKVCVTTVTDRVSKLETRQEE